MVPITMSGVTRRADIQYVADCVAGAKCCAVIGLSNTGKSHLLRALVLPQVMQQALKDHAGQVVFVYIDFNLMLDVSEQGFYELILRSILAELERLGLDSGLVDRVHQAYQGIVTPASPFVVALSFIEGIMMVNAGLGRRLVLLFDEFDEPFTGLEGRVFLNLRALKDRYPQDICYVTATGQRLPEIRRDHGASEFAELFAHNVRFLKPLDRTEAAWLMQEVAAEEEAALCPEEVDFTWEQAGGHPGLLDVVCRGLIEARGAALAGQREFQRARELLDSDLNVRTECAKLWNDLSDVERQALMRFLASGSGIDLSESFDHLCEEGILIRDSNGQWVVFGQLFRDFVSRQRLIHQKNNRGVRIDVEAGEVRVDGKPVPDLTGLEYRLLLLFYGNIGKICDKYKVVEAVWSEAYLDEVDDARIEKLISRLRQKIEPNLDEPRYLITIRGRGYKLAGPAD